MMEILSEIVNKNKSKINFIFSLFSVFILMFFLNKVYPFLPDDWLYSFYYDRDFLTGRINSVWDIFNSQYDHYLLWGGRSIVHAIDQLLLMFDFPIICILNALTFTLFIYQIYFIGNKKLNINSFVLVLTALLVYLAQPAFCETVLWKTGSVNYLWGTLIVVAFMYKYYSFFRQRTASDSIWEIIFMFLFGIIAGWTNENMSLALIFFIIIILFFIKKEYNFIPNWAIAGLIGVIIGCVFMLVAPGNYLRIKAEFQEELPFLPSIERSFTYFLRYILRLLGIYIIFIFLYKKYPKDMNEKQNIIISSFVFLITGFVALLIMGASPMFPKRALFGILAMFIISILIIYANIDFRTKSLKILNILCFAVLLLLFSIDYYKKYNILSLAFSQWEEREAYLEEQKNKGIDTIIFTSPVIENDKYALIDLSEDSQNWVNKVYSRFYGVKSVRLIKNK